MAIARNRRDSGMNYWPGFVDALSTLVLGVIFLLTVFVVAQFFLSQEVAGKDTALSRLNALVATLTDELSLEKSSKVSLEDELTRMRASLARRRERARPPQGCAAAGGRRRVGRAVRGAEPGQRSRRSARLAEADQRPRARPGRGAEPADRGAAPSARRRAAGARRQREDDQASQEKIADLGQRLNVALAQRVQELSRYRSDFFGRLRAILGERPDIRIVGDRFVFQSEVFFDPGQATLRPEGKAEIDKIAGVLTDLEKQIPSDIAWVLRVDGHTDVRPIASAQFPSNWALSSARAISVVQYLISKGISPQHLVAAGFGEFQPLDTDKTEDAYRKNRRIELKLTER